MRAPVVFGWVSGRLISPFVVIADADGNAVAQAIGATVEEAIRNAKVIICAVNQAHPSSEECGGRQAQVPSAKPNFTGP